MHAPGELVFRTDPTTDLRRAMPWFGRVLGLAVVLVALGLVTGVVPLTVSAGLVACVCVLLLLMGLTTIGTVTIAGGMVDHRRWTGRHVRLRIDEDLRALHAPYLSAMPHSSSSPRLTVRHGSRGPRITLTRSMWSATQLDQLVEALRADSTHELLDARAWQERAPGLIAWWERHWIASLVGVTVGFWVVVIGILVLVDQLS